MRVSHLNIAFMVTECIMTCIEEDDDLFLIILDAQKAFDKLNHEILHVFNKLMMVSLVTYGPYSEICTETCLYR